jgi:phosphatidate cytidylyltransferase
MKTLITRTLTGIVYLALLGFAFLGSNYVLLSFFSCLLVISIIEYIRMAQQFPVPKCNGLRRTLIIFLPLVWIFLPIFLLEYWCIILNAKNIIVALFIILCTNDTLAYLFGSLLGKHKMWLKVSPKKSWEGFWGGLICSLAVSYFIKDIPYFRNDGFTTPYSWMGFALVLIISGTFGDFAESMVKRFAHQKDSGFILPGHGGVLDRIDSLLFAVPAGFIYWWFFLNV